MNSLKLPLARNFSWQQLRSLSRFAIRRLDEERLPQVAGSLTFTTVLAIVPLLTIALALFTTFPLFNAFRKALEAYFIQNLMPKTIANTIIGNLNLFASKASRLSAIGAVFLIGTAVAMIEIVDRTFNQIWRVKIKRAFMQRIVVYWAIVTLGPLLIGISITITSYLFTATNSVVSSMPLIGNLFYTLVSILLTTGAFTLLYMVVPNKQVDWKDALTGGVMASIAFEVTKRLFAIFIAQFPTYTMVYGALAAIPIFLIWIYLCWLIALSGAVVAAALPVVKYERWWHIPQPGSDFLDAMSILQVLHEARASHKTSAIDAAAIRTRIRLGIDESENLLQKMLQAGWVGRIKPEAGKKMRLGKSGDSGLDQWTLLINPEQLKVAEVYRLFAYTVHSDTAIARDVCEVIENGLGQTLSIYFARKA